MPTVTTNYAGSMLFETKIGSHVITADVPASMGGSDRAPTPPDLFVASLGACVGAFVAQYCDRRDIDTTGLSVDVTFEKADNPVRLENLKVRINLPDCTVGDRRAALLRVAEHCPVHETIETVESIEFELIDASGA
ncbi:MAG: OsmC family protein [Acidimicrobiia bacterium]|jgi:putative redox protein